MPKQDDVDAVQAARDRLKKKMGSTQTGGKGSVRRKKGNKANNKKGNSNASDDKKVLNAGKKLQVQKLDISGVEIYQNDNTMITIQRPSVHANMNAHLFIVQGKGEVSNTFESQLRCFSREICFR